MKIVLVVILVIALILSLKTMDRKYFGLIIGQKYFDKYVIWRKFHKSRWIPSRAKDGVHFEVRFDQSWGYFFKGGDALDVNKVFGFSEGLDPHKDSARLGARWNNDRSVIELFAYTYCKGKRSITKMIECYPDQTVRCMIIPRANYYKFQLEINGTTDTTWEPRDQYCVDKQWKLFPYFGGNRRAPHKVITYIREIS